MSTPDYDPEPEQIMAFARWLQRNDVKRALAIYMPKLGGPSAARENRIADIAAALQIHAAVKAEQLPREQFADQRHDNDKREEAGQ